VKTPRRFAWPLALFAAAVWPACAAAQARPTLSEQDWLEELPVVLSVSRLAQPQSEAPGAVTVIDRDSLLRLGARDIYDVLRLVPGFLVSGWNGASPVAAYHNVLDQYGTKLQVFIDGRSVYSTFYVGGTQRGLLGVVLEDIERIEILRGSNSAAYGANAFLGVINIVTRHAADSHGTLLSVTRGEGGVNDNAVRYGWGSDNASFRISMSHRADNGLQGVHDDTHIGQLHLRGDLRPSAQDEVMLQAGGIRESWGDGIPGSLGNSERTPMMRNAFVVGEWRHLLGGGEDVKLAFSHDDEYFRDRIAYPHPHPIYRGVYLDGGGKGRRTQLEVQHSFVPGADLRAVWGSAVRDERVWSPPLYYGHDWISAQQLRVFGNVEWRAHRQWVVNAGAMWERHSVVGSALSPRLMVNFHLVPGQTLRAGVTRSQRVPTLFELNADVRYYNAANTLVGWTWDIRGHLKPENLLVREVGWLGEFRPLRLSVDLRGYRETMTGYVTSQSYFNGVTNVRDKINSDDTLVMRGFEYQLRWQPTASTRIWLSHMSTRSLWPNPTESMSTSSPKRADSLAVFQNLPGGFGLTATYAETGAMTWQGLGDKLPPQRRVDLRLAKRFEIGATRAEAAVTVQAATGSYQEFLPARTFDRRGFASLRLEF